MTNSQRLALVRRCLTRWLADRTTRSTGENRFRESILIRDGFYCGRRFDAGSHEAIWFFEEDEIKIFDELGDLLDRLQGDQIDAVADVEVRETPIAKPMLPALYDPVFAKLADHEPRMGAAMPAPKTGGDQDDRLIRRAA